MKLDTAILFLLALGLIAGSIDSELQHRRIKEIQTQVKEIQNIVNQKFLPVIILDKQNLAIL